MRKSRARAIHEQERQNPNGMSSATYRAAKRRYSNGLNHMTPPNPVVPKGQQGFPFNHVQIIQAQAEVRPNAKRHRKKMITRVLSIPPHR